MNFPADLKYTKDHEWVKINGSDATIGITDFAQRELGDIVFGTVEAVKTVSDLFMPLTGEVLEVNKDIDSAPESVNADPYGKGWMIKIKFTNAAEVSELLSVEDYKKLIGA